VIAASHTNNGRAVKLFHALASGYALNVKHKGHTACNEIAKKVCPG
jgi:hypothetical protein